MADGITYAGQPCVLDLGGQLQRYLDARWPRSRWPAERSRLDDPLRAHPFLGRGLAQAFASPYPDVPAPRINELIVPTGASRYARALIVLGAEQMAAVAATVWGRTGTDLNASLPSIGRESGRSDQLVPFEAQITGTVWAQVDRTGP